jgi:hypothetical protein
MKNKAFRVVAISMWSKNELVYIKYILKAE